MLSDADGGPALFRLVRFWSRRWSARASAELTGELRHVQHIQAVEAVHTAGQAASRGGEATVNAIAHQLGLDHSGASRMVRDAAQAGYLVRAESEMDKRRTVVRLTPSGEQLLADARNWQRTVFDELTRSWEEHDRAQLAHYLRRLVGEVGA
ncbi:transcriptional regulator [Actinosynnema sp. ALI-1.44]|uniref:MarR family winged helix-turn-helix transcriptional regulator n=1 Tax=Actinosynnema sp. ALI-1.44 TaxID=1933779 RepID=UPI00097BE91F|nr:MarR family winged helix-turn-helix transcriptional regulator [Actinosynnema sp. ALI-1.44]ONI74998.1 transcriptional regulator [Actinosynnema sp. ALI-1.44]